MTNETKLRFHVGDRVRLIKRPKRPNDAWILSLLPGDEGTVCELCYYGFPEEDRNVYSVDWDKEFPCGYASGGGARESHGWRVYGYQIELVCDDIDNDMNPPCDTAFDSFLSGIGVSL